MFVLYITLRRSALPYRVMRWVLTKCFGGI